MGWQSTTVMLYNCTPLVGNGGKTPFKLYYSKKPDLVHMHQFRASMHMLIPSRLRGKLNHRTRSAIYLGPARENVSHHRVWFPDTEAISKT